jgi:hypothetical protein
MGFSFKVHDELSAVKGLVFGPSAQLASELHFHLKNFAALGHESLAFFVFIVKQ